MHQDRLKLLVITVKDLRIPHMATRMSSEHFFFETTQISEGAGDFNNICVWCVSSCIFGLK
jgi:hypothetical protein